MYILGIESSCDETSASVSHHRKILSNTTVNQLIHKEYGGVVPEIASREHLELITKVVEYALLDSGVKINQIDAIAVTNGPGLKGALMVGVNFAKGLSIAKNIPLVGVNHMEGHLFSNFIDLKEIRYPFLCLLVSGGHTQIWNVRKYKDYELLSNTIDDAAGEAFDKGARLLGMPYPGGPEIEKLAKGGDLDKFKFPIAKIKGSENNFSFSGLKTSLYYLIKNNDEDMISRNKKHIAASYQETILETLIQKMIFISKKTKVYDIFISGGVIANTRFRDKIAQINAMPNYNINCPNMKYCTDNAAMICMAGYEKVINNNFSNLSLDVHPNLLMNQ